MVIKRVYIEQFGKLKGKEFSFSPGINIIYGKNESGKTTLEQFLLTMFYGHRTSKKYGVDPREKYIPFGQDFTYGQMDLEINETSFLMERKIGKKRKDDVFRSFDEETLDQASFDEHLGKQLFDLDLDPFLKTLFVTQTGLRFLSEKDESLNTKLNNLLETGDEDISFTKAMSIIDLEMKKIKTPRKTGLLDQLYDQLNDRFQRLDQAKKNKEAHDLVEKKLEKAHEAYQSSQENIMELEKLKGKIHLYEVRDQVLVIHENLQYIEKLKEERELSQHSITMEELDFLKEQLEDMEIVQEEINHLEDEIHGQRRRLTSLEIEIEAYVGYEEIPANMALNLVKNEGEEKLILEKLKHFADENLLPSKLVDKKDELQKLLRLYEKHLKKLKARTKNPKSIFASLGGFLFLFQALLTKSWLYSGLTLVLIFLISFGLGKLSQKIRTFHLRRADRLEEEIKTLSKILNMDPMEVIKSKRLIEQLPKKHEKESLELQLAKLQEESLRAFTMTSSKSVEEFVENEKTYLILKQERKELQILLLKNQKYIEDKINSLKIRKMKLVQSLTPYGFSDEQDEFGLFLKTLAEKKQRELNLLAKEESLRYTLKSLIGDQTIEEVEMEVKTLEKLGLLSAQNIQSVEEKQLVWAEEEKRWAIEIKGLTLEKLKYREEEPIQIEDEISTLLEEEVRLKRRYLVLETTRELMESSYKELRAKYIGALNEKVSDIFNAITKTQRNIKVADHFSMKYEEKRKILEDNSLSKGALDQLYFALRFAMIDLIFKGEEVPVFLDEPFVSYDEERLKNTLDYLHANENNHQIFIFTCHEREVHLLKEYGHVIYMN